MPHTDFYEYTMMPAHLSKRFTVEELKGWSMSRPFEFTKDLAFAKSFCGSLGQYMLRYIYDITEQKMYSLEEIPFA